MEEITKIQPILSLIISLATLIGLMFALYKTFREPDIKALQEIALLKNSCAFKHKDIDSDIKTIKTNHLHHIEADVRELKENQIKIFTILNERLPSKNAL